MAKVAVKKGARIFKLDKNASGRRVAEIKFTATKEEREIIMDIVYKWLDLEQDSNSDPLAKKQDLLMDIEACHCNGCKLDLLGLLHAKPFDFVHDIYGIHRHLSRTTGKLMGCFLPRCARKKGFGG